jgi:hypothetical protein
MPSKKSPATATTVVVTPKVQLTTKRFVIRKSLIGTNTVISFTNSKNVVCTYDHDKVYNQLKSKFDLMPCFAKYGSYTNTNNLPAFVRALPEIV